MPLNHKTKSLVSEANMSWDAMSNIRPTIMPLQPVQQEYRGLVQYYQLAYNLHRFDSLKWVMEQSLTKTIAHKLRITVKRVYLRYATTIETPDGPRRVLQVKINRETQPPLITYWGGISLKHNKDAVIDDSPKQIWNFRTELIQQLIAHTCELCGSQQAVEVHHVRRLSNLHRQGRDEKPEWVIKMAARRRKTLVVCRKCHNDIHAGRTDGYYIHQ